MHCELTVAQLTRVSTRCLKRCAAPCGQRRKSALLHQGRSRTSPAIFKIGVQQQLQSVSLCHLTADTQIYLVKIDCIDMLCSCMVPGILPNWPSTKLGFCPRAKPTLKQGWHIRIVIYDLDVAIQRLTAYMPLWSPILCQKRVVDAKRRLAKCRKKEERYMYMFSMAHRDFKQRICKW